MGVRVRLEDGSCGESRQQPLPLAASPVLTRVGVTKGQGSCAKPETVPPLPGGGGQMPTLPTSGGPRTAVACRAGGSSHVPSWLSSCWLHRVGGCPGSCSFQAHPAVNPNQRRQAGVWQAHLWAGLGWPRGHWTQGPERDQALFSESVSHV